MGCRSSKALLAGGLGKDSAGLGTPTARGEGDERRRGAGATISTNTAAVPPPASCAPPPTAIATPAFAQPAGPMAGTAGIASERGASAGTAPVPAGGTAASAATVAATTATSRPTFNLSTVQNGILLQGLPTASSVLLALLHRFGRDFLAVCDLAEHQRILSISDSIRDVLGYLPEECVGKTKAEFWSTSDRPALLGSDTRTHEAAKFVLDLLLKGEEPPEELEHGFKVTKTKGVLGQILYLLDLNQIEGKVRCGPHLDLEQGGCKTSSSAVDVADGGAVGSGGSNKGSSGHDGETSAYKWISSNSVIVLSATPGLVQQELQVPKLPPFVAPPAAPPSQKEGEGQGGRTHKGPKHTSPVLDSSFRPLSEAAAAETRVDKWLPRHRGKILPPPPVPQSRLPSAEMAEVAPQASGISGLTPTTTSSGAQAPKSLVDTLCLADYGVNVILCVDETDRKKVEDARREKAARGRASHAMKALTRYLFHGLRVPLQSLLLAGEELDLQLQTYESQKASEDQQTRHPIFFPQGEGRHPDSSLSAESYSPTVLSGPSSEAGEGAEMGPRELTRMVTSSAASIRCVLQQALLLAELQDALQQPPIPQLANLPGCCLHEVIKDEVHLFGDVAQKNKINLRLFDHCLCSEPLKTALVDPKRVAQALDAYLINAFRHTGRGGKVSVHVFAAPLMEAQPIPPPSLLPNGESPSLSVVARELLDPRFSLVDVISDEETLEGSTTEGSGRTMSASPSTSAPHVVTASELPLADSSSPALVVASGMLAEEKKARGRRATISSHPAAFKISESPSLLALAVLGPSILPPPTLAPAVAATEARLASAVSPDEAPTPADAALSAVQSAQRSSALTAPTAEVTSRQVSAETAAASATGLSVGTGRSSFSAVTSSVEAAAASATAIAPLGSTPRAGTKTAADGGKTKRVSRKEEASRRDDTLTSIAASAAAGDKPVELVHLTSLGTAALYSSQFSSSPSKGSGTTTPALQKMLMQKPPSSPGSPVPGLKGGMELASQENLSNSSAVIPSAGVLVMDPQNVLHIMRPKNGQASTAATVNTIASAAEEKPKDDDDLLGALVPASSALGSQSLKSPSRTAGGSLQSLSVPSAASPAALPGIRGGASDTEGDERMMSIVFPRRGHAYLRSEGESGSDYEEDKDEESDNSEEHRATEDEHKSVDSGSLMAPIPVRYLGNVLPVVSFGSSSAASRYRAGSHTSTGTGTSQSFSESGEKGEKSSVRFMAEAALPPSSKSASSEPSVHPSNYLPFVAAADLSRARSYARKMDLRLLKELNKRGVRIDEDTKLPPWHVLVVGVEDTGSGLRPDHADSLFSSFAVLRPQSDLREDGTGAGLGISIVSQIAAKHGGRAGVISAVGVGAVFYFILVVPSAEGSSFPAASPLLSETVEGQPSFSAGAASAGKLGDGTTTPFPSPLGPELIAGATTASRGPSSLAEREEYKALAGQNILVVEDLQSINKLLCRQMTRRGAVCAAAFDGREALMMIYRRELANYVDKGLITRLVAERRLSKLSVLSDLEFARPESHPPFEEQLVVMHDAVLAAISPLLSAPSPAVVTPSPLPLGAKPFTAITADAVMPRLSGYQMVRLLRRLEETKGAAPPSRHLPVVGVSANALAEDARAFLLCGADRFEGKPISLPSLILTLRELTEGSVQPAKPVAPTA